MFSKNKNKERIDSESREQYDYARRRIAQKKKLMRHFVAFLAGSVLIIVLNILNVGKDILPNDWWIFAILIWVFIFLIHLFNVFITNKFMDKEWEDKQLEKLKAKQEVRVAELKKQAMQEVTVRENKIAKEQDALKEMTRDTKSELPRVKKNNPNQLPPEQG
ncbi:hypothetical protein ULMS_23990 [Patiriisocius marinistellae]|uniref:2TM domain-containing protein n=1 Tax=Patiriisocius marinistellae TaxID=2494560 RepID=A0A5J4G3F8_9FLAO|nr:2TM domain-containing protein [Patiriisocius marinistellae]GEQ86891.1 hypothetical protein ULMS_23990 [Patiriisocius marinistellae]